MTAPDRAADRTRDELIDHIVTEHGATDDLSSCWPNTDLLEHFHRRVHRDVRSRWLDRITYPIPTHDHEEMPEWHAQAG